MGATSPSLGRGRAARGRAVPVAAALALQPIAAPPAGRELAEVGVTQYHPRPSRLQHRHLSKFSQTVQG